MNGAACLLAGLCLLAAAGCGQADRPETAQEDGMATESMAYPGTDLKADLGILAGKRVLFGHQSVGRDILDGLRGLAEKHGVPLRLDRPEASPPAARRGGIEEFKVGRNEDPRSKCDDFLRVLAAAADGYDAVMMKFCYVDIADGADVDAVFAAYRDFAAKAKALAPSAVFVHATVPLWRDDAGWKTRVKRLLGRDPHGAANAKRNAFNRRLIEAYAGEPVFDIARAESTRPDGSRTSFTRDGRAVYTLAPEYTYDGGHLNAAGKERLAAELARTLAARLR